MSNLSKKQKEKLLKDYQDKIESKELIQLEIKDKYDFRKRWLSEQNNTCPILKQKIKFKDSSIDHRHKLKSDELGGDDNLGLIRGILHRQANAWEGKVTNSFHRVGLHKLINISEALRNLADFYEGYENNPIPPIYIYPGEEPKVKKKLLGKRAYNKVKKHYFKVYPRKRILPKRTKFLTKDWKRYILETDTYLKRKQNNKSRKKRRKQ